MGDGYALSGGVVHWQDCQMLHQRPAAPDIERLGAEADAEQRLVEVVGVLEEELVDGLTGAVGGGALGDGVLAVLLGVDVGWAAGEQEALAAAIRSAICF